jgi:hypothetical protein
MQVLDPVDEVVRVEQHLGADEAVAEQLLVVGLDEAALPGCRDRLQCDHVGRPDANPSAATPAATAPDDTTTTS